MSNKITQLALLFMLLFSQIADAFACQSMSCLEKPMVGIDASESNMSIHAAHNLMEIASSVDTTIAAESIASCDCCQLQCNCPASMISILALLNSDTINPTNLVTYKLPEFSSRMVSTILTMPQRPPKPFIS